MIKFRTDTITQKSTEYILSLNAMAKRNDCYREDQPGGGRKPLQFALSYAHGLIFSWLPLELLKFKSYTLMINHSRTS